MIEAVAQSKRMEMYDEARNEADEKEEFLLNQRWEIRLMKKTNLRIGERRTTMMKGGGRRKRIIYEDKEMSLRSSDKSEL